MNVHVLFRPDGLGCVDQIALRAKLLCLSEASFIIVNGVAVHSVANVWVWLHLLMADTGSE
jgi:hypothetical protein